MNTWEEAYGHFSSEEIESLREAVNAAMTKGVFYKEGGFLINDPADNPDAVAALIEIMDVTENINRHHALRKITN